MRPATPVYMRDLLPIVQMMNAVVRHVRTLNLRSVMVMLGNGREGRLRIHSQQIARPVGDLAMRHDLVRSEAANLQALERRRTRERNVRCQSATTSPPRLTLALLEHFAEVDLDALQRYRQLVSPKLAYSAPEPCGSTWPKRE